MSKEKNEGKSGGPVPGSYKIVKDQTENSSQAPLDNPNIIRVPRKILHIISFAFGIFSIIIFVFIVYIFGQIAEREGLVLKLQSRLTATVQALCKKDVDEVVFAKSKDENGKIKTTIVCNKEKK